MGSSLSPVFWPVSKVSKMAHSINTRKKHGEEVVNWLLDNYELSDAACCISKASVYQDYLTMCQVERLHPTTGPAFGKLVRRAFPSVVSNRRGPRGHALHMYAGLQKRYHPGTTSDSNTHPILLSNSDRDSSDFMPLAEYTVADRREYSAHDRDAPVSPGLTIVPPILDITPAPFPAVVTATHSSTRKPSSPSSSPDPRIMNRLQPQPQPQLRHARSQPYQQPVTMDIDGRSFTSSGGATYYQQQARAGSPCAIDDYPPSTQSSPVWMSSLARSESYPDVRWSSPDHAGASVSTSSGMLKFGAEVSPDRYAQLPSIAAFNELSDWSRVEKGDSSEEISAVVDAVEECTLEPARERPHPQSHQGSIGWVVPVGGGISAPPWPIPSNTAHAARYQGSYQQPIVCTRPHSQSAPPEYHEPSQPPYYPSDHFGRTGARRQSHPPPNFALVPGLPAQSDFSSSFPSLPTQTSAVASHPSVNPHSQGFVPRGNENPLLNQRQSPSSPSASFVRSTERVEVGRSLSTPIIFDSTSIEGRHLAELSAFTSLCRRYYSKFYHCVITCNLDALRLEIERFWEYMSKDFANVFCYESVRQRILQIESRVFCELGEILTAEDLGLGIDQLSVYLHNLAFVLPAWFSQARRAIMPPPMFAAAHENVSNFAMQLYRQSLRLQKMSNVRSTFPIQSI